MLLFNRVQRCMRSAHALPHFCTLQVQAEHSDFPCCFRDLVCQGPLGNMSPPIPQRKHTACLVHRGYTESGNTGRLYTAM